MIAEIIPDPERIQKEIERLKKKIHYLNDVIALQANKVGSTNVLVLFAREEKILQDRIQRKKQALKDLEGLQKQMLRVKGM